MTGSGIQVRHTRVDDFAGIIDLTRDVYPTTPPWTEAQLAAHLRVFPEGQFVAVDTRGTVVGMAASLIVRWDDYTIDTSWRDFTSAGTFANHDPLRGRTLYGAEVMVARGRQGQGIGTMLYDARRALAVRLGLRRIRAGARLRGYHEVASHMSAQDYVDQVAAGQLRDPTLSFQINRGFRVIGVVPGYLLHDPRSLGYAAVIEWVNPAAEAETRTA